MVGGRSGFNQLFARLDAAQILSVLDQELEPRAFLAWTRSTRAQPIFSRAIKKWIPNFGRLLLLPRPPFIAILGRERQVATPPTGGDPAFLPIPCCYAPWRGEILILQTPTLVIKGQCDYLSWSSGIDYRDTLPDAALAGFLSGVVLYGGFAVGLNKWPNLTDADKERAAAMKTAARAMTPAGSIRTGCTCRPRDIRSLPLASPQSSPRFCRRASNRGRKRGHSRAEQRVHLATAPVAPLCGSHAPNCA